MMTRPESSEFGRVRSVVADRIRELRLGKGWSQEELADRAGCHRTYVGMLERGQGNPSLLVLARIADALGVGVKALVVSG